MRMEHEPNQQGVIVGPLIHVTRDLEKIINDLNSKTYISYINPFMD